MLHRIKKLVVGRPNGFRRQILNMVFGEDEDTSPNASFSSPMGQDNAQSDGVTSSYTPATKNMEPPKGVTPPEGFEVVLHKEALEEGQILEVIIAGTAIAVAKANGKVYAFSNTCPHAGGPLSEGTLEIGEDHVLVRCPYHGWDFDLDSGNCLTSSDFDVGCYETHLEGDAVCVKI
jgi:nitrite reductase/ring-hydroxylating ferredoxin subunit